MRGPYYHGCRINSSPPGQNGRRIADDIFKCTLVYEMLCISIKISLKFVPKGPIDNKPALHSCVRNALYFD